MSLNLVPSNFTISKVSTQDFMYGNFTNENVLFKQNPSVKPWVNITEGKVLDYVASAIPNIYAKGGTMIDAFAANKTTKFTDTEWIRWDLKGTGKNKIFLIENMQPDNSHPCINFTSIELEFSHGLWRSSDVIYPEKFPSIEFIIEGAGQSSGGTGTVYTLKLKTRSEFEFVEPEVFEANTIWCKRGANHSEASGEYGSSSFDEAASIINFQTQLGSYSKRHEFTDKAAHQILRLKATDAAGNYIKGFPDQLVVYDDAKFKLQTKYERTSALFWGRDAGQNLIDPTTGYYRRTAPGMVEFYQDGNMLEYDETNFTVDFLRDTLTRFFYGKVLPENANIKVKSGIALLTLVQKALTKEYAVRPVQKPHEHYVKSGNSFPGSKQPGAHLTEPQILGFDMFPYGTVTFEHFPILDDEEMNGGLRHPNSHYPVTSYWGLIDDIGIGIDSNLTHYVLSNSEYFNYICGAYSPAGAISQGNSRGFTSTHGRRSYEIVYSIVEGMVMKDTKRSLFLSPMGASY